MIVQKFLKSSFKDLLVYRKAFDPAMDIFTISKSFLKEGTYFLTSQIRHSSRSVCSKLAEGYRKRLYKSHFISKISDSDMENSETQVWLDFSFACKNIQTKTYMVTKLVNLKKLAGYVTTCW